MEERGLGYVVDMLVFALLVSTAILMLAAASPADPEVDSSRYAASFAQSTLLSLQGTTADQLGGFEYMLGAFGFELDLPVLRESARRELDGKTPAQLLAEDALLNLCVEAGGHDVTILRPNQCMDEQLKAFLRSALDRMVGGRFGYRLRARTRPADLGFARVHFETYVENLAGGNDQLCSETIMLSLPASQEELTQRIGEMLAVDLPELEVDPVVEVSLELWSR